MHLVWNSYGWLPRLRKRVHWRAQPAELGIFSRGNGDGINRLTRYISNSWTPIMTSLQIESGFHPWAGYSQKNWHGWGCAARFLKPSPYLWSKRLENHILWGRTYLYSPYKDVTPSPRGEVFSLAGFALLLSVISLKISRHSLSQPIRRNIAKTNRDSLAHVSRASRRLHVLASIFDWFTGLSVFFWSKWLYDANCNWKQLHLRQLTAARPRPNDLSVLRPAIFDFNARKTIGIKILWSVWRPKSYI